MPNAVTTEKLYALAAAASDARISFTVSSDDRTYTQQSGLYSGGAGSNPVAAPGTSQHEYGFAFDVVPSPNTAAQRKKLAGLAKKVGLVSIVESNNVHFQLFSNSDWKVILKAPALLSAFTAKKQAVKYKGTTFTATSSSGGAFYGDRSQPGGITGRPSGITLPNPNSGGTSTYNPSLTQLIQNIWDTITGGGTPDPSVIQNFNSMVTFKGVQFPGTIPGLVQGYQPRDIALKWGLPFLGSGSPGGVLRSVVDTGAGVIITASPTPTGTTSTGSVGGGSIATGSSTSPGGVSGNLGY